MTLRVFVLFFACCSCASAQTLHPVGLSPVGAHWSGVGVRDHLNSTGSWNQVRVRVNTMFGSSLVGENPELMTGTSPGCNQQLVTLEVYGTRVNNAGTVGAPVTSYVNLYIGRNGYIRVGSGDAPFQFDLISALMADGCQIRTTNGTPGTWSPISGVAGGFYVGFFEALANSQNQRQDFREWIPRCPSGVWDNDGGEDSGSGGGTSPDPATDPDDTDTDEDGVPDYKDIDPNDSEVGESWDFESWLGTFKESFREWDWGFEPDEIEDEDMYATFSFQMPNGATVNFTVNSFIDTSTTVGAAIDAIRILARTFMLCQFYYLVFCWCYRDIQGLK